MEVKIGDSQDMDKSKMARLRDLGEKEIIRTIIKPLFNPTNNLQGIGDDCAIINIDNENVVCVSTDRVPADLISFKLGIIDYYGLGYYLAILNISDIFACGASPVGLLLTLAFPNDFHVDDFKMLLNGVKVACDKFACSVIGGDLSNSSEISISATSMGIAKGRAILYRSKAQVGDLVFCTEFLGLSATAFYYFLNLKPRGIVLAFDDEAILADQFRKPHARVNESKYLSHSGRCTSCMDNTDGVSQSYSELAEINKVRFCVDEKRLPVHEVSRKVAAHLGIDVLDVIFAAGADFQLLGTLDRDTSASEIRELEENGIRIIGEVQNGDGFWVKGSTTGEPVYYGARGWNYYSEKGGFV